MKAIARAANPATISSNTPGDLDGDNDFSDAAGMHPDVTDHFAKLGVGDYLVHLSVTDTNASAYPGKGQGDLSDTDSAHVLVKAAGDAACGCVVDLQAQPMKGGVQLAWSDTGTRHFNIYRSNSQDGPYMLLGTTRPQESGKLDTTVANDNTYYYVLREADGDEGCPPVEADATPVAEPAADAKAEVPAMPPAITSSPVATGNRN